MTRQASQISTAQALAGAAAVLAVLAAVVLLCRGLLVPPSEPAPLPPAPPQDSVGALGTVECPGVADLPPEPIEVTSTQVIDCPAVYDGRAVRYEGEVVNAILLRDERAWVQLNDDPYGVRLGPLPAHRSAVGGNSGLAVSIPIDAARDIAHVGGHRAHGDGILVTGIFHRDDPADGGGLTIQARTAEVIRSGTAFDHPVQGGRVVVAIVLGVATLALAAVAVRGRRG